jgi:hypothetical protein
MPDDPFEQELLADIAEAETFGEDGLAAEWRIELNAYRAARTQARADSPDQEVFSTPEARREALRGRRPESP